MESLAEFREASALVRDTAQKKLFSHIDILTDSRAGLEFVYDHMEDLLEAGIFTGTPWEDPAQLVPSLVGGTLLVGGGTTVIEILSELRFLALSQHKLPQTLGTSTQAHRFLKEMMVSNLDLIFPTASEHQRNVESSVRAKVTHLMEFILSYIPLSSIKERLAEEIELVCTQRPVVTDRALEMIKTVRAEFVLDPKNAVDKRLLNFVRAVFEPTPKSTKVSFEDYRSILRSMDDKELLEECSHLGKHLRSTGLAVQYHTILLNRCVHSKKLLKVALGLDRSGGAELDKHFTFVQRLITETLHPGTSRSCYGLACLLERGLLSRQTVHSSLSRLLDIEIHPTVKEALHHSRPDSPLHARFILLSDVLSILGQPLGIGQGWNPTCQSARGISLWSEHAPGKLLRMIITVCQSNNLQFRFEGDVLESSVLDLGLAKEFDYNLDAVSVVLVPHLDKLYNEMMNRAALRTDDPHKWVNPALYGHWIPTGFISAYDYISNSIKDYGRFIRTFYATHHPKYNGGYDLAYANPVGIFLTSSTGKLLGFHAVSILRVQEVKKEVRVYFLNPNNEGRQRWQSNIQPSVSGFGERPGESSLPFYQFASRLYAFHFNESDLGDISRVEESDVLRVRQEAEHSWGTAYQWIDSLYV